MPVNPECGKRVKQLCKYECITQKELSKRIQYSEKTISGVISGGKHLSQSVAEAIVKVFPRYNLGWLMGLDDNVTRIDAEIAQWERRREETKQYHDLLDAVALLAREAGFEITHSLEAGKVWVKRIGDPSEWQFTSDYLPFKNFVHESVDHLGVRLEYLTGGTRQLYQLASALNVQPTPVDKGD